MNESVVQLGADKRLVGILTTPSSTPAPLACLFLNAGVVHRVGPHRLNVKMARMLAHRGFTSLRIDLSGLGDSAPVSGRENLRHNQPVADLQTAMDFLERERNIRQFAVVGICSGAVNVYALGLADPRAVGLLMFDGYMFPTAKTHIIAHWRKFQRLSWASRFERLRMKLSAIATRGSNTPEATDGPQQPTSAEFATSMRTLVQRGADVFIMYSGSFFEQHNYRKQLADAFRGEGFLSQIRYDYRPHIDHTITPLEAQKELLSEVGDWCEAVARSTTHNDAGQHNARPVPFKANADTV